MELKRKCRKPSQEDPAAVSPARSEIVSPSPSAKECIWLQTETKDTTHKVKITKANYLVIILNEVALLCFLKTTVNSNGMEFE